jgi:hypothetical protein
VSINDSAALRPGSNSWTVSFWVKAANVNQLGGVLFKFQNSGSYPGWGVAIAGDINGSTPGKKIVAVYQASYSGNRRNAVTNLDVIDGNWHHIAMVQNKTSGATSIYIDGISVSITTDSSGSWPTISNTNTVYIGQDNVGDYFNGQIDDVRIYNRALSSPEIQSDMNNSP